MNRYRLVSNTGKRLLLRTYNDAARIQRKLKEKGINTIMKIQRGN
jgi:hypothetical protein